MNALGDPLASPVASPVDSPHGLPAGLWQHSVDLLLALTADGGIGAASPAWTQMLGLDPERLRGQQLTALLHPDDGAACSAALARAGRGGPQRFAARLRAADGHHHACSWTVASGDGSLFAVGREDLPDADDRDADDAARARRSLAMARLAGGIAHDFNNLLQALRNTLELIRLRPADAAAVGNWTQSGLRIIERGARLTAQLVAASGTRRDESVVPVAVLPLLQSLQARLRQILAAEVTVRIAADAVAGNVLADAKQLEVALLNLSLNASEAMPTGGTVTLGASRLRVQRDRELPTGDYICLEVADTGPGMSDSVRERAFEPFFTTKAVGAGAGLGLAQVHGFARRNGGTVRIASSGDGGTALHLLLPALTTPAAAAAAAPRPGRVVVCAGAYTDGVCEQLRLLGWQGVAVADVAAALAAAQGGAGDVAALVLAAGADAEIAARLLAVENPPVGVVQLGGDVLPHPVQLQALADAVRRAAAQSGR